MTSVRSAILRGKLEAVRLHRELDLRSLIERRGGNIDVFDALARCGVPLIFKPLDKLVGVFTRDPLPGALVTTRGPYGVQRMIAAHELGHFRLGHAASLDDEALLWRSPYDQTADYDHQEMEADAFAAEFLTPPWLIASHMRRQFWTSQMMADPVRVYQLSLRMGITYEATCRTLARPGIGIIGPWTLEALLRVRPRQIKKALLGEHEPATWDGDVWLLTPKDEGTSIAGTRWDLIVLQMPEHSGGGYSWRFEDLGESDFAIVRDLRERLAEEQIGGRVLRSLTVSSLRRQRGKLALNESRTEQKDAPALSTFQVDYSLTGPEENGLSLAEWREPAQAA